ncbi:MAG: hypothetical protein LBP31_00255 [Holosporales bacterium]|jgi:hypothetical protein|nr:hypothetical protein [Holosporales bacterium]
MIKSFEKISLITLQCLVLVENSAYTSPNYFSDVKAAARVLSNVDIFDESNNQVLKHEPPQKNILSSSKIVAPRSSLSLNTKADKITDEVLRPVTSIREKTTDAHKLMSKTLPIIHSDKNRHKSSRTTTSEPDNKPNNEPYKILMIPYAVKPPYNTSANTHVFTDREDHANTNAHEPSRYTPPSTFRSRSSSSVMLHSHFSNTESISSNLTFSPYKSPLSSNANTYNDSGISLMPHPHQVDDEVTRPYEYVPSTPTSRERSISPSSSKRKLSKRPPCLSPADSTLKILRIMQENISQSKGEDALEFMSMFFARGKTELLALSASLMAIEQSIGQVLNSSFSIANITDVSLGDGTGSVIASASANGISPEIVIATISPLTSELLFPKSAQLFESSFLFTKSISKSVLEEAIGKPPKFDLSYNQIVQNNRFSDNAQLFLALLQLLGNNNNIHSNTSFYTLNSNNMNSNNINNNNQMPTACVVFLDILRGMTTSSSYDLNSELQKLLNGSEKIPDEYIIHFKNFQETTGHSILREPLQTPDEFVKSIEHKNPEKSTLIFNFSARQSSKFSFFMKPQFNGNNIDSKMLQLNFITSIPPEAYEESKISAEATVSEITKLTKEYFDKVTNCDQSKIERNYKQKNSPAPTSLTGGLLWSLSPSSSPPLPNSPLPTRSPPLVNSPGLESNNAENVLRQLFELIKSYTAYKQYGKAQQPSD